MKSNPQLGILIYGLVLVFSSFEIEARLGSIVPPQCDPEYKGTMPPNIEFLCKSIAKLWDSNNVEDDSDQNDFLTFARNIKGEKRDYNTFARSIKAGGHTFARNIRDYNTFARGIKGDHTFARNIRDYNTFARSIRDFNTFARSIREFPPFHLQ